MGARSRPLLGSSSPLDADALLIILINWLGLWQLNIVKRWNADEVALWFIVAAIQYFTCSLISMKPKEEGTVDMVAFYERQRPVIFSAFLSLMVTALIMNYWDRNHSEGLTPSSWIEENGLVLLNAATCGIAGWARPKWLQWLAGLGMMILTLYFFVTYAVPG